MAYKVIIPEDITEPGKEFLRSKGYEVVVVKGNTSEEFEKEAPGADALLARTAKYPREVLEKMPNLKVIGRHGVGFDNIDLDYCNEKKIQVTITPTSTSNAVAEHTIMLILACARNLMFQNRSLLAGTGWTTRNTTKGQEIFGKTLGIIGCGRIGKMVAQKAALGLGMKVIGYDPVIPMDVKIDHMERVASVEEILQQSDFVSLHVPETPQTHEMVNEEFLSRMKPTASLINCSRGGIVDEKALYDALSEKKIRAAGADVLVTEPFSKDDRLLTLDNMIVTPHTATLNAETMDKMGLYAAQGIDEVLSGKKPTWPVNKL